MCQECNDLREKGEQEEGLRWSTLPPQQQNLEIREIREKIRAFLRNPEGKKPSFNLDEWEWINRNLW